MTDTTADPPDALAATAAEPPMPPGRYLRLRREAAQLSLDDVAHMLAPAAHGRDRVAAQLSLIELDTPSPAAADLVDELHGIYSFDLDVYGLLVAHAADPACELPLPQICRICGCSWNDPCQDDETGPCAWVEGQDDLCTHCLGAVAVAAAVLRGKPGGPGHAG